MIPRHSGMRIVDGFDLDPRLRRCLRPGELIEDREGRLHRLPRYFYEVESDRKARATSLTAHFTMNEFLAVDVREAPELREWPRYVPLAVGMLAAHLELFRLAVGAPIHLAANGGYRSPTHSLAATATAHSWGAAADVFQIGNELLDTRARLERYGTLAIDTLPGVWVSPYGPGRGQADDHLHLELGYVVVAPRGAPGEEPEEGGR